VRHSNYLIFSSEDNESVIRLYQLDTVEMQITRDQGLIKWSPELRTTIEEALAIELGIAFEKFSLQECHPKGVSDMLMAGAGAVVDAAMHTS
jgi:hypothetical protein